MLKVIEDTNEGLDWNENKDKKEDFVFVTYAFSTSINPKEAAYFLAREQSVSTYNRLHGETLEMREQRSAKVFSVDEKKFIIAYPTININTIGELLVTINGNGNFLNANIFSKLIVEDVEFPDSFLSKFAGPKYGKEILSWFNVQNRPLLIGVQKPSIGLPAKEHVERALEAFRGGCDIVKDDEQLYPDDPANLLKERLDILSRELPKLRNEAGKHFMYIFNLENESEILEHIKLIEQKSSEHLFAIMLSPLLGLPFVRYIRENTSLPIFTHPSGFGIYTRGPFGFSNKVLTTILRICGVDCVIHPAPYSKIAECSPEIANDVKVACDKSLDNIKQSIISFGGGMRKENYKQTKELMKGTDFIFLVGGAIFGNKNGPKIGSEELIDYMTKN